MENLIQVLISLLILIIGWVVFRIIAGSKLSNRWKQFGKYILILFSITLLFFAAILILAYLGSDKSKVITTINSLDYKNVYKITVTTAEYTYGVAPKDSLVIENVEIIEQIVSHLSKLENIDVFSGSSDYQEYFIWNVFLTVSHKEHLLDNVYFDIGKTRENKYFIRIWNKKFYMEFVVGLYKNDALGKLLNSITPF